MIETRLHFFCRCGVIVNAPEDCATRAGECPVCGKIIIVPDNAFAMRNPMLSAVLEAEPLAEEEFGEVEGLDEIEEIIEMMEEAPEGEVADDVPELVPLEAQIVEESDREAFEEVEPEAAGDAGYVDEVQEAPLVEEPVDEQPVEAAARFEVDDTPEEFVELQSASSDAAVDFGLDEEAGEGYEEPEARPASRPSRRAERSGRWKSSAAERTARTTARSRRPSRDEAAQDATSARGRRSSRGARRSRGGAPAEAAASANTLLIVAIVAVLVTAVVVAALVVMK